MRTGLLLLLGASAGLAQDGVKAKDVTFYSEDVQCHARIFLPKDFSATGKSPAVLLAPGWGETAASIEKYAAHFAAQGLVAMTIDYRGWGESGGYIYLLDNLRYDDRLRFSQHTAKVRIRRKRLLPKDQVLDIRNAISYLQGEPGVDRARIGVWGTDMAGGHAIVVAANDARVKCIVAQTPLISGVDASKKTTRAPAAVEQQMIKLARTGQAPATPLAAAAMSIDETKLALAEYHPLWYAEQVPQSTAVLFVVAANDAKVDNEKNAVAASKKLRGETSVHSIHGATHVLSGKSLETAAGAAADWFVKHL
jgi:dienelactone hydrolase